MIRLLDLLILGVLIAVLFILAKVIAGTPLIRRVAESFSNPPISSTTFCPPGSRMNMYGGTAFCCSGKLDNSADTAEQSCQPLNTRDEKFTFCTLGPAQGDIPNCRDIVNSQMDEQSATFCPPGANYIRATATHGARCCFGATNADRTECLTGSTEFCNVAEGDRWMSMPSSCQFLKSQSDTAAACPSGFGTFTSTPATNSNLAGLTLIGCTDGKGNCYPRSTVQRLTEMGYDVAGLPVC